MMSNENHGEEEIFSMTGQGDDHRATPEEVSGADSEDIEALDAPGTDGWYMRFGPKILQFSTWDRISWDNLPVKPEGAFPSITGRQMVLVKRV